MDAVFRVVVIFMLKSVIACEDRSTGCFLMASSSRLNWHDAKNECEKIGAQLPSPSNERDWDALMELLIRSGVNETWLGAREVAADWMWVSDGSVVSPQGCYRDYLAKPDLPHRRQMASLVPQMCVARCLSDGFRYAGTQSGNACYCGDTYGAHNRTSGNQTCSVACSGDNSLHCGGWARNFIYNVHGGYASWAYRQPDNAHGQEACALMNGETNDYKFSDELCTMKHPFICILDISSCHFGAIGELTSAGQCVLIENRPHSWYAAVDYCQHYNGHLAKINNETVHDDLKEFLAMSNETRAAKHWIGLTSRHWVWQNGEAVDSMANLTMRQSNDLQCVDSHLYKGKARARDCGHPHPVICQNVTSIATTEVQKWPMTTHMSSIDRHENTTTNLKTGTAITTETARNTTATEKPENITQDDVTPETTHAVNMARDEQTHHVTAPLLTTSKQEANNVTTWPAVTSEHEMDNVTAWLEMTSEQEMNNVTTWPEMTSEQEMNNLTTWPEMTSEQEMNNVTTWPEMTSEQEIDNTHATDESTKHTHASTEKTTTKSQENNKKDSNIFDDDDENLNNGKRTTTSEKHTLSTLYIILIVLAVIFAITILLVTVFAALKNKKPRSVDSVPNRGGE